MTSSYKSHIATSQGLADQPTFSTPSTDDTSKADLEHMPSGLITRLRENTFDIIGTL